MKTPKELIKILFASIFSVLLARKVDTDMCIQALIIAFLIVGILYFYSQWKQSHIIVHSFKQTDTRCNAPILYNNSMNIHVWLHEFNKYFNSAKIASDKDKQKEILNHLDSTSQEVIKKMISKKSITSYNELENYLKSLFSNHNYAASNYAIEFYERFQRPNESLHKFHEALTELATQAFLDTPKNIIHHNISTQFIHGLNNSTIRNQFLLENFDKKEEVDVLIKACEMQTKIFKHTSRICLHFKLQSRKSHKKGSHTN